MTLTRPARELRHKWTEDEDRLLREEYDSEKGTSTRLARILGMKQHNVYCRANRLGLARKNFVLWTESEDNQLRQLVTKYPVSQIAKIMHITENRILGRLGRLGISTKYRDGWYTLQDVVNILHVKREVLRRCIDEGKLVATWHQGREPKQGGKNFYHIEETDLRKFIIEYRFELDGRRVDLPTVVDILVNHNGDCLLHRQPLGRG